MSGTLEYQVDVQRREGHWFCCQALSSVLHRVAKTWVSISSLLMYSSLEVVVESNGAGVLLRESMALSFLQLSRFAEAVVNEIEIP